eukprot:EG_transcript_4944
MAVQDGCILLEEGSDRAISSDGDLELVLRKGFEVIESLFSQFDEDRCGSIPFLQLKAGLEARGLADSEKFNKLWKGNIDKDQNNKADIGEFLVVVYFWQFRGLGTYLDLFGQSTTKSACVKLSMETLHKQYQKYDTNGNGYLSRTELVKFFREELPNVRIGGALAAFNTKKPEISFSQFMRALFTSISKKGRIPPDANGDGAPEEQKPLTQLVQLYSVLEEDFVALGQGSTVTLQRLLVPAEHQLSPATTDVGAPCVICHTAATHGCSNPGCSYYVCTACFNNGVKTHIPAFKGPGGQVVTECIRSNFCTVDADGSGSLDFFEYTMLAFLCCQSISYSAVCPTCRAASKVKEGMMAVQAAFQSYDVDGSGGLTWAEVSGFLRRCLGTVPANAQTLFGELAPASQSIALKGFFTLLYRLTCPTGKYLHQFPGKKPVEQPEISIAPDSIARPLLPALSAVDLRKIRWGKQLGRGGQTTVYLVEYDGVPLVARKPLPGTPARVLEDTLRGARLQMKFQHPHIARIAGVHEAQPVCILVEYCEGGDVYSLWKGSSRTNPIQPPLQWRLALELAEALNVLHTATPPVIHRDIKGCNVFLDKDRHVLMADFDLATTAPAKGMCGTPGYMAPEVLSGGLYDCTADVFAYGGYLYEVTHGCFPHSREVRFGDFHEQVRKRILLGRTPALSPAVPAPMQQLIAQCWQTKPASRPTMAQVI